MMAAYKKIALLVQCDKGKSADDEPRLEKIAEVYFIVICCHLLTTNILNSNTDDIRTNRLNSSKQVEAIFCFLF